MLFTEREGGGGGGEVELMSSSCRGLKLNIASIYHQGKLCPSFERYSFVHSRYDTAKVVNYGFLVRAQYTSASFLMIAPRSENFVGKMAVRVVCHFADKGLMSCCNLFLDVGYIKEFIPYCIICDVLLFHLIHTDAEDASNSDM